MGNKDFDLSIYLVTNAEMVPEGIDFVEQVKRAVESGVTIVQLREKDIDTREFIRRAEAIHEITKEAGVPLIINDRVDVALAIDAEGVHVGQDDMPVPLVRQLIGDDKIIGVSTGYVDEVEQAIKDGADYIGIGILFDTKTKVTTKLPMGPIGVHNLLEKLKEHDSQIKTCVIGGVNHSNIQRARFVSSIEGYSIDGAAIVSCIMAKEDARSATIDLKNLWDTKLPVLKSIQVTNNLTTEINQLKFIESVNELKVKVPLIHHITNSVVKNFQANVTLAIGSSPIMSENIEEFEEFSKIGCDSSLVLNTGTTVTNDEVSIYLSAIKNYNCHGKPIVYDPVGGGATLYRKKLIKRLLIGGYMSVIKGNFGEICALAGVDKPMKGVDSESDDNDKENDYAIEIGVRAAIMTRSVIVITGKDDIIIDGVLNNENELTENEVKNIKIAIVKGGNKLISKITGSGCSLASIIASFVSINTEQPFISTVTAVSIYKKASSIAGSTSVNGDKTIGSGTFSVNLLDALKGISDNAEKVFNESSFKFEVKDNNRITILA
ncbi:hypothetical protein BVG19_g199 [[Candida] boidinii]|nr:hypothetical protein BVG19_g199 [[Candida] boidinii]OWB49816.1 kinase activity protein [[Candida] boidinii]